MMDEKNREGTIATKILEAEKQTDEIHKEWILNWQESRSSQTYYTAPLPLKAQKLGAPGSMGGVKKIGEWM